MTQPHEAGQPADTKAAAEATGATSLFELYQRLDDALHQDMQQQPSHVPNGGGGPATLGQLSCMRHSDGSNVRLHARLRRIASTVCLEAHGEPCKTVDNVGKRMVREKETSLPKWEGLAGPALRRSVVQRLLRDHPLSIPPQLEQVLTSKALLGKWKDHKCRKSGVTAPVQNEREQRSKMANGLLGQPGRRTMLDPRLTASGKRGGLAGKSAFVSAESMIRREKRGSDGVRNDESDGNGAHEGALGGDASRGGRGRFERTERVRAGVVRGSYRGHYGVPSGRYGDDGEEEGNRDTVATRKKWNHSQVTAEFVTPRGLRRAKLGVRKSEDGHGAGGRVGSGTGGEKRAEASGKHAAGAGSVASPAEKHEAVNEHIERLVRMRAKRLNLDLPDALTPDDVPSFLKNIDGVMAERMLNEIIVEAPGTRWDDIAGLEKQKSVMRELVVWPLLNPSLFTGARRPPKGVLLFGPPGTGKTLIGKMLATESTSTFLAVSASSLTSKWVGEGEKMVRAMFAVARALQPSIIFMDEVDSLLTSRSDNDNESSRRMKTEFLVQLDGVGTCSGDNILILGATNRPQELDEAARRRFVKRLYVPLPEEDGRRQFMTTFLTRECKHALSEEDINTVVEKTSGYSGSDLRSLGTEAAIGPLRALGSKMQSATEDSVRPIVLDDFTAALRHVRPSVSPEEIIHYISWNEQFGSATS